MLDKGMLLMHSYVHVVHVFCLVVVHHSMHVMYIHVRWWACRMVCWMWVVHSMGRMMGGSHHSSNTTHHTAQQSTQLYTSWDTAHSV